MSELELVFLKQIYYHSPKIESRKIDRKIKFLILKMLNSRVHGEKNNQRDLNLL